MLQRSCLFNWLFKGTSKNADSRSIRAWQLVAVRSLSQQITHHLNTLQILTIHLSFVWKDDLPPSTRGIDGQSFLKALLDVGAPHPLWVSFKSSLRPFSHGLAIAGFLRHPVRAAATTPLGRNDDGSSANNTPRKRRMDSLKMFSRCLWTLTFFFIFWFSVNNRNQCQQTKWYRQREHWGFTCLINTFLT